VPEADKVMPDGYRANGGENHVFCNTEDIESQLPDIFRSITITEDARQRMRKDLTDWFNAEANNSEELKRAEARLVKLGRMEQNLQRLAIEEEISFGDFKEHRSRIEAERARLRSTVDDIKQRQHLVKADFIMKAIVFSVLRDPLLSLGKSGFPDFKHCLLF